MNASKINVLNSLTFEATLEHGVCKAYSNMHNSASRCSYGCKKLAVENVCFEVRVKNTTSTE